MSRGVAAAVCEHGAEAAVTVEAVSRLGFAGNGMAAEESGPSGCLTYRAVGLRRIASQDGLELVGEHWAIGQAAARRQWQNEAAPAPPPQAQVKHTTRSREPSSSGSLREAGAARLASMDGRLSQGVACSGLALFIHRSI